MILKSKILKFFRINLFSLLWIGAVAVVLSSCRDENSVTPADDDPSQMVTVELTVPYNNSFGGSVSSRAEGDEEGDNTEESGGNKVVSESNQEGWLSNLYLISIKVKDADGNNLTTPAFNVFELDTSGYNPQVGEDKSPSKFYVNLSPGTYYFYLLGNFDRYLQRFQRIPNIKDEDELKDIYMQFTASMPLVPAHLPMAAEPDDFSGNADYFEGKYFTIAKKTGNSTDEKKYEINAKLHFLCSKVRYTILYNNEPGGCSEMFGNNSIRFIVNQTTDRPRAEHLREKVYFYSGAQASPLTYVDGTWPLTLNRYKYPKNNDDSFNENYPKSSSDNLEPWVDQPNLSEWKNSRKRVWQGVAYLPENFPDETAQDFPYTELTFPYVMERYKGEDGNYEDAVIEANTDLPEKKFSLFGNTADVHYGPDYTDNPITENYSKGLIRGYFYDVVAKVQNVDEGRLEMFIQVYVGAQPWIYHENEQEW